MNSTAKAVRFDFDLVMTGQDTAAGSFTAAGEALTDDGRAFQVFWYTKEGNVQGIKTLVGEKGSITLRFTSTPKPEGIAVGHYIVIDGSGDYENIHGEGETQAALVFGSLPDVKDPVPTGIKGSYSGKVHFD